MKNKKQKTRNHLFKSVVSSPMRLWGVVYMASALLFVTSCKQQVKGNPDRFKQGVFEIPAVDNYGKTTITRIDSLQIEVFEKIKTVTENGVTKEVRTQQIDTLFITWKNNFAYTLRMKTPRTELDKDPIFVQINKVTDTSYSFIAKIGYSNFKQKGTVYIKQ